MIKQSFFISLLIFMLGSSPSYASLYGAVNIVGFDTGSFVKVSDGFWEERRADDSVVYRFAEVESTIYTILIADPARSVKILFNFGDHKIYYSDQNSAFRELALMTWGRQRGTDIQLRNEQGELLDDHPGEILKEPDLSKVWKSKYGPINWGKVTFIDPKSISGRPPLSSEVMDHHGLIPYREGGYGEPDNTLHGVLYRRFGGDFYFSGFWSRKSDPSKKGAVFFKFYDGKSFTGVYTASNGERNGWDGSLD